VGCLEQGFKNILQTSVQTKYAYYGFVVVLAAVLIHGVHARPSADCGM
jgi:hypothetical protein